MSTEYPAERIVDALIDHRLDLFTSAELRLVDQGLAAAGLPSGGHPVHGHSVGAPLREEIAWSLFQRDEEAS